MIPHLQMRRDIKIFFLVLHENICCGFSSEAPRRSNEYHNMCFRREIRKKYQYFSVGMEYGEYIVYERD